MLCVPSLELEVYEWLHVARLDLYDKIYYEDNGDGLKDKRHLSDKSAEGVEERGW